MNRTFVISTCLLAALLISCGKTRPAAPTVAASLPADVAVTFDGPRNTCEISRPDDANSQSMPCVEVPSYLTKTLKLPRGSSLDYKTIPDVNVPEFDQVTSELKAAGYQLTPGVHVGFLTEPKPHHP